jgi:hypothetical protein
LNAPVASAPSAGPTAPFLTRIEALLAKFLSGNGTAADLAALKRDLTGADPRQAIAAITAFLATGQDARTGQDFAIGPGGQLDNAPTLRVFLLDLLGSLARQIRSGDAAAIARTILESKSSADEWAISLRNIAWHDPNATAFLSGKMREMLGYEPWLQSPSSGMLEAFDVAVFTKDPALISPLADALLSNRSRQQRADAISLDRLAELAPLEVMTYLNANPAAMTDRPFVRADYFAKADVAQPAQRQALEVYLSRPDVSGAEKAKLFEALATPSSFISENLLTTPIPEPDEAARNGAIAQMTSDWLAKRRFPELAPQITALQQRIEAP